MSGSGPPSLCGLLSHQMSLVILRSRDITVLTPVFAARPWIWLRSDGDHLPRSPGSDAHLRPIVFLMNAQQQLTHVESGQEVLFFLLRRSSQLMASRRSIARAPSGRVMHTYSFSCGNTRFCSVQHIWTLFFCVSSHLPKLTQTIRG